MAIGVLVRPVVGRGVYFGIEISGFVDHGRNFV